MCCYISILQIIYLQTSEPFLRRTDQKLELFNEFCTLLVTYSFIAIAQASLLSIKSSNSDEYSTGAPELESVIGSFIIFLVLLLLAVNLIVLALKSGVDLFKNAKKCKCKREKETDVPS